MKPRESWREKLGQKARITPYWRTLKAGGVLNEKYPGGIARQKQQLKAEGHTVIKKGKFHVVKELEKTSFDFGRGASDWDDPAHPRSASPTCSIQSKRSSSPPVLQKTVGQLRRTPPHVAPLYRQQIFLVVFWRKLR